MRRHRAAEGGGPYLLSAGVGPFAGNPDVHNQKDRPHGRSFLLYAPEEKRYWMPIILIRN